MSPDFFANAVVLVTVDFMVKLLDKGDDFNWYFHLSFSDISLRYERKELFHMTYIDKDMKNGR